MSFPPTADAQRRRERILAAIGLTLGAAVGVVAAFALSGCGITRPPLGSPERISDAQLRALVADFNAAQHGVSIQ